MIDLLIYLGVDPIEMEVVKLREGVVGVLVDDTLGFVEISDDRNYYSAHLTASQHQPGGGVGLPPVEKISLLVKLPSLICNKSNVCQFTLSSSTRDVSPSNP